MRLGDGCSVGPPCDWLVEPFDAPMELEPEPERQPSTEPEPEPEQKPSAGQAYSPVTLEWRETDDISSAESTPMSTPVPRGTSSGDRAHTPVSLEWRDTEEISSDDEDATEDEIESDDDEDDEDDEGDDTASSDDSWSEGPDLHDDDSGGVEARIQAEIDARVAHELAVREHSLAAARGVRDLATEVQAILEQSEHSELLQRVAPVSNAGQQAGEASWTEAAAALAQLCDGLSARVTASVAYDPVAVKAVQKRLADDGHCTLLPGLEEHELAALQQKFGARFPPELRAFLRCGVPVDPKPAKIDAFERQSGEGWVNWRLLLDRGVKCGGDKDVVTLRRSEWAALLSPACRAQSAEYPVLPIFGRHVIPSVPSRSGLPIWTLAVDVPTGGGAASGFVDAASSVGATFWHWLESEHGMDGIKGSIPAEWLAAAVPVEQVPFWPEKIDGLL
eukprot:COSAG03_NODE_167_length_11280_cov_8.065468_6_plen_448_part_00